MPKLGQVYRVRLQLIEMALLDSIVPLGLALLLVEHEDANLAVRS